MESYVYTCRIVHWFQFHGDDASSNLIDYKAFEESCDKVHKPFVEVPKGTFVAGGAYGCLCLHISSGWWFGTWIIFSHLLGRIIIPTDKYFSEGWLNHQPDHVVSFTLHPMGWSPVSPYPFSVRLEEFLSSIGMEHLRIVLSHKDANKSNYHCLSLGFCHFPWELLYIHPDCMMMSSYILLSANMRHVWLLLGGQKGTRLNSIWYFFSIWPLARANDHFSNQWMIQRKSWWKPFSKKVLKCEMDTDSWGSPYPVVPVVPSSYWPSKWDPGRIMLCWCSPRDAEIDEMKVVFQPPWQGKIGNLGGWSRIPMNYIYIYIRISICVYTLFLVIYIYAHTSHIQL